MDSAERERERANSAHRRPTKERADREGGGGENTLKIGFFVTATELREMEAGMRRGKVGVFVWRSLAQDCATLRGCSTGHDAHHSSASLASQGHWNTTGDFNSPESERENTQLGKCAHTHTTPRWVFTLLFLSLCLSVCVHALTQ